MDPARDAAGIVRRDIARRFWRPYFQALVLTVEAKGWDGIQPAKPTSS